MSSLESDGGYATQDTVLASAQLQVYEVNHDKAVESPAVLGGPSSGAQTNELP